jgi:GT2 family glycosyltransferase
MSSDRIRVEIVAPVHNRREITLLCLRSLSNIRTDGMDVHIIIVDDGSTDGTSDAIRKNFPNVDVIQGDGDLWFTEGTNVGVRAALEREPHFVLMINDDAVFAPDFLVNLVDTAQRNVRSVVGPLLLLWDQPHHVFQVSPVWETRLGGWRHWYSQTVWTVPERPWKVDLIVGNCVLVRADAFREAGLMNSNRYPNFGDAEFTPRLRRLGWQLLIDPRARIFCQPNAVPPRIRSMGLRKLFSSLILDLKSGPNLRRRLFASLDGAPTKIQGFAAFVIFLARAAIGRSSETASWGESIEEPPLSETFRSAQVDE